MIVRPMQPADQESVFALARQLWPDEAEIDFAGERVLVAELDGRIVGFASFSLRPAKFQP